MFLKDYGGGSYAFTYDECHQAKQAGGPQIKLDFKIPVNKKVSYDSTTGRPDDLNAAWRLIVISELPGMKTADQKTTNAAAYGSNRVLVSCRSFLQYVDA